MGILGGISRCFNGDDGFEGIIDLIIILIVLQFLCSCVLGKERDC